MESVWPENRLPSFATDENLKLLPSPRSVWEKFEENPNREEKKE
jgi:hypothetical protein